LPPRLPASLPVGLKSIEHAYRLRNVVPALKTGRIGLSAMWMRIAQVKLAEHRNARA
jgi:hypothetical protein